MSSLRPAPSPVPVATPTPTPSPSPSPSPGTVPGPVPGPVASPDPGRSHLGGYVLAEAEGGEPDVLLIAAGGGEVEVALGARAILQRDGISARVVAMPRLERFRQQPAAYREQVLPGRVRARVSVTAGAALGWYELLGDAGIPVGLDRSGTGSPYTALLRQHGFTAERVAATARAVLARAGHRHREHV
ncbi:transketolase-like TK C-terminal-containing protein [Streptomyces sp. NPDC090445]|uniref:transketolase-like TK C-terminal-containing protein n=1 Tax=Streptomyces sp. NPDC090445 TaxID=3365963 RepID=UPI00381C459F